MAVPPTKNHPIPNIQTHSNNISKTIMSANINTSLVAVNSVQTENTVTVGTLKAGASTAEDVFPRLPLSPKKGAAIFSLVHPNSLTLQKLNNGNSNHLRPKWHHYTNCPPARKHERDCPQSSNPSPGPAKNARLPGKSGQKPCVFPAITPMRLPELSPSPINPLHNPFLSP